MLLFFGMTTHITYGCTVSFASKERCPECISAVLCDTRTDGEVKNIRTDGGCKFQGRFQQMCDERRVKRELTTPHSPGYNGVEERGLQVVEAISRAACIQAKHIFNDSRLPEKTGHLWGEALNWACESLTMTATTATPGMKSPYERLHGQSPIPQVKTFLRPVT